MGITTTQLAAKMNLSKGRISQLVKQGVFDGCFTGEGRARRFNLAQCLVAYGDKTDVRQGSGNAEKTHAAVEQIQSGLDFEGSGGAGLQGGQKPQKDNVSQRLNLARARKEEMQAARLEREERVELGAWVRADEAASAARRQMAKEIAIFEGVVKDMARFVADKNALNFKVVRADMMKILRDARTRRAGELEDTAVVEEVQKKEA